jgi:hypothetical protein
MSLAELTYRVVQAVAPCKLELTEKPLAAKARRRMMNTKRYFASCS